MCIASMPLSWCMFERNIYCLGNKFYICLSGFPASLWTSRSKPLEFLGHQWKLTRTRNDKTRLIKSTRLAKHSSMQEALFLEKIVFSAVLGAFLSARLDVGNMSRWTEGKSLNLAAGVLPSKRSFWNLSVLGGGCLCTCCEWDSGV